MADSKNYIIIGPQASGKGTQAELISKKYDIPHISTGDIFREIRKQDTELGRQVRELIDQGRLVPDDKVLEIVKQRLSKPDCEYGFVLDGYPRTVEQAKQLEDVVEIDKAIFIEVPKEVCIKRISGRYQNKAGRIYNIHTSPKPKKMEFDDLGKLIRAYDDETGEELFQRDDDKPETVKKRLELYEQKTAPIKDYYGSHKPEAVVEVNGDQAIEKVFEEIIRKLETEQ